MVVGAAVTSERNRDHHPHSPATASIASMANYLKAFSTKKDCASYSIENINLGCFYLVGMPVVVQLAFVMGSDFKGLWLRLMAAQMSCVVAMMSVICRTDWETQVEKAKALTGSDSESSSTNGASVPSGNQQPSDKLVNIKIDQQR
ncbi:DETOXIFICATION 49 protein [Nymphaea thermarum]|nr:DETOXIFICATION 49 protein [Nymphaea thermarum]